MAINEKDDLFKSSNQKKASLDKFNALRALAMGMMQQSSHQKSKEHQSWLSKFFDFLFHRKKKHHHSNNEVNTQSSESNVVDETLKSPEEVDAPTTTTKKPSAKYTIDLNLDGPDIEVHLNLESTEPGVILSSSNPSDYNFYEARNIEGMQKAAIVNADEKTMYAQTIAGIEQEAYRKTAQEMGFDMQIENSANGQIKYTIRDPNNNNNPITAEQMAQFKEKSAHYFNDIANERLRPFNLSINKECKSQHPQPTPGTGYNEPELPEPVISFLSNPGNTPTLAPR